MALKEGSKRQKFTVEFMVDRNRTQAAIRAGFSEKTAYSAGARLLKDVEIKKEIGRLIAEQTKRTLVEADDVIRELKIIGFSNIRQLYDKSGNLMDIGKLLPRVARAVSGIDVDELTEGKGDNKRKIGVTRKIRMWDKVKALELLGKHLGIFEENVNLTVTGLAERMKKARERANGTKHTAG